MAHNIPRSAHSELLNETRYPAFRIEAADLLDVVPSFEWLETLVAKEQIANDITLVQGCMLGFKLFSAAGSWYDRDAACLFILLDKVPDEHASVINSYCRSLDLEMVSQIAILIVFQVIDRHFVVHFVYNVGRIFDKRCNHLTCEPFSPHLNHDNGTAFNSILAHPVALLRLIKNDSEFIEACEVALGLFSDISLYFLIILIAFSRTVSAAGTWLYHSVY